MDFAQKVIGKSGIVSHYIFRDKILDESIEYINKELELINQFIKEKKYNFIYPEIILTNRSKSAHLIALQADGIGSFKANTIISDFNVDDKSLEHHFANLKSYDILKKNVILLKGSQLNSDEFKSNMRSNRIDVWVSGFKANLYLMLFIPVLLTKNSEWSNTTIYLRTIVGTDREKETYEKKIKTILTEGRINARFDIISLKKDDSEKFDNNINGDFQHENHKLKRTHTVKNIIQQNLQSGGKFFNRIINIFSNIEPNVYAEKERELINNIIIETSKDARLVVMGLKIPEKGKENAYAATMKKLIAELPTTILVKGKYNINLFL